MEIAFIEQLNALDKLVVDRAPIGTIRNLISSLREQAEAEANRTAELVVTNQKIVAEHAQLATEHAKLAAEHTKLKTQQPKTPTEIIMKTGVGRHRSMT
jgi:hypothetical protein